MPPKAAGTFTHSFSQENEGHLDDFYKVDKKKLGEGSYGSVSKAVHKDTGAVRACKAIDKSKIADASRFKTEVDIQRSLDHPHIVKLYEVFNDAKYIYLVMELCTGGELFDRILEQVENYQGDESRAFSEQGAATYMSQIMGAMSYLHNNNFVHRDIKPENFLMQNTESSAAIKVIDFGLAKAFNIGSKDFMKTKAGTPYYVAPQVLQGNYDEKCDIWSCGVIAYILLCGYPPFFGDDDSDILQMVKKGSFSFPPEDWHGVSNEAKDCISQMLTKDPTKRPSAAQVLSHKWMNNAEAPKGTVSADLFSKLKKFQSGSRMKKVALTLIAQQLKDEDLRELQETFLKLDGNKDGTLSIQEITQGIEEKGISMTPDMTETLKMLDTDGSGNIDYTEFLAATLTTKQYLNRDVMWAAFRVFDRDGDGSITKAELQVILNTTEGIDQMIKEVDLDGDGNISFAEFVSMMEKGTNEKTPGGP